MHHGKKEASMSQSSASVSPSELISETSFNKEIPAVFSTIQVTDTELAKKEDGNKGRKPARFKEDTVAWFVSMVFLVVILGAMWIWGTVNNWYAQSGYGYENVNQTGRFDTEPFGCNDTSEPGRSGLPDCTASWYFWKLPSDMITPLTRSVMWILYSTHQIFIWALIYKAQLEMSPENRRKRNEKGPRYGQGMRWFNWAQLIVNAIFHVLHLLQTHWTYDGISQDVSLSSSQSSVILMISLIMLIEYRDRGIALMWPNPRSTDPIARKIRLNMKPINYVRKYHGYFFSWSIVYTFWYHPMENTWAHTTGFLHTGMLLIQGSLIYTDMHTNKYWKLINESWVLWHGTIVALQTADPLRPDSLWPMFCFGFGFLFFFTQIFMLPFWKDISAWWRVLPPVIFYAVALIVFGTYLPGGLSDLWQTVTIPSIQYINLFLAWLVLYAFIKIEEMATCACSYGAPTRGWNVLYLVSVLLIYSALVLSSILLNYVEVNFLILMEINVAAMVLIISATIMLHKRMLGPFRRDNRVNSASQR